MDVINIARLALLEISMEYLTEKIWFLSELELFKLCRLIQKEFNLQEFEFDAENLYEWGIATDQDGLWQINISRKHREGEPQPQEFYHLLFAGDVPALDKIAHGIARLIDREVYFGAINYLGGDDYQYCPSNTFKLDN